MKSQHIQQYLCIVIDALVVYYAAFLAIMDRNLANSSILIHVLKNNMQECDEWQNVGHETYKCWP